MSIYTETLEKRFSGKLSRGKHHEDGIACALEVASVARGNEWSDDPVAAGLPDLRPINDAFSSDVLRTKCMVPLIEVLYDWWPTDLERRKRFAERIALRIIREILPAVLEKLNLPYHAKACHEADCLTIAIAAASAANFAASAASAAATAAVSASYAAVSASYAASESARCAASVASFAANSAALAASAAASVASFAAEVGPGAGLGDDILVIACELFAEEAVMSEK